ncbi:F box protein 36 [Echinococcus multilocularis]|uniref:F box protein 36 n=1 Tax=Echinococcus multilocularis TaxID=6211 RepID=A0A068Y971_ECHMU|nr:F box protein 36 [Echinococcus multilocularis]
MLTCFESPIFKCYQIFNDEVVATFTATAPSPQRDLYHLQVLKDKIIWRSWRITSRNEADKYSPTQLVESFSGFKQNEQLRDSSYYGEKYWQLDFLPRMPPSILKRIINFLDAEDIVNLGRSCKSIFEICNSDDVWRAVYCRYHKEPPSEVVRELAEKYGWKRVFFTNKLKLQLQIRRLRLNRGQPAGDEAANDKINNVASGKTPTLMDSQSQHPQKAYLRGFANLES